MRSPSRNKIIVAVAAFVALLFFVWWGSFDGVGDVLRDPGMYESRTVHLFGKTGPAYSVPFVGSLYKFHDSTGSMWVISDNDSTMQDKYMYLEAICRMDLDEAASKLKGKLKEVLDEEIVGKGRTMPPILVEKERGGILASLRAIRARK